ncbi:unnamed protein product, partial [Iphiclides podalirius]
MGECSEAELEKELDEVMAYHKRFISIEAIERSPGTLNWADVASRGCNAEQLHSLRWVQ